jgi:tRNA nucleotidyltransferase (CCA-adding enzyme)
VERPDDISRLLVEEVAVAHVEPVFAAIADLQNSVDGVYLVGGAVRDVLLGAESFDVDIAVEGDAIGFARALARALEGRYTPHEKFGTAVVQYGDGSRVDVVTTRTERYLAPGALPAVQPATIAEDLHRRDFTINAMAVSLKKADFGRLVHPFGGRKDLQDGVIRVLHDLSFVDDPTRILRAVRYESRYGFRLDEHSEGLARQCIARGLVAEVSPVRLRDELLPLLEDSGAARGIARLGELGADRALHSGLRGDADGAALFTRAIVLRDELGVDVPAWRIGLAVLARELTADAAFDWLDGLDVKHRDVELIIGAVTFAPQIVERLRGAPIAPAEIVALADPLAPDTPLLALALEDRPELREYFTHLRGIELEIGGAELAELGLPESPRVGELLAELRRRKLNGELDGRDAELAAARELVGGSGS